MSKHDEKVKQMLDLLEKKKIDLGKKPSQVLKTNGLLKFSDSTHVNLNTITTVDEAVKSLAQILCNQFAYAEACKSLGVTSTFNYSGYPIEDWITDLKFRVDVINFNAKQAEFNQISKKLEGLISEDLRTETELGNIEAMLK